MARMTKQIGFNLFEMNTVGHISHGLWVHPDNTRHRFNDLEFWVEEAKLLEAGTLAIRSETELVLKSRWVVPERLVDAGFAFEFASFESAVRDITRKDPA